MNGSLYDRASGALLKEVETLRSRVDDVCVVDGIISTNIIPDSVGKAVLRGLHVITVL